MRKPYRVPSDEDLKDAVTLYQNGLGVPRLAPLLGLSKEYMRRRLQVLTILRGTGRGLSMRIRSETYFRQLPLLWGAHARIARIAYEELELTASKIARLMRLTTLCARDMLRDQGVTIGRETAHRSRNASRLVQDALKSGLLTRGPCEGCGVGPYEGERLVVIGHHDDYNKPLEVRWLCPGCHKAWHTTNTPIMEIR